MLGIFCEALQPKHMYGVTSAWGWPRAWRCLLNFPP